MRSIPLFLLGCFGLGLSVSAAPGGEPGARVIRVAVVDTGFKAPWRDELNRTFRERFQIAVEQRAGAGLAVRAETVNSRTAATRLHEGACDAVMIVGPERPRAFWRIETPIIAASLGADRNFEPVYLIIAGGDADVRRWLGEGLSVAVTAPADARGFGVAVVP